MKYTDKRYLWVISKQRLTIHRKNLRNILARALGIGFDSTVYDMVKDELDSTIDWYSGFYSASMVACRERGDYRFLDELEKRRRIQLLDNYSEYRLMFAVSKSIDRHNRKCGHHG